VGVLIIGKYDQFIQNKSPQVKTKYLPGLITASCNDLGVSMKFSRMCIALGMNEPTPAPPPQIAIDGDSGLHAA
jgi:hypothetical protein